MAQLARVRTSALDLAYEHDGPTNALPVVLLHGYPYDVRAFVNAGVIGSQRAIGTGSH